VRNKLRDRLRQEAGLDPPEWLLASRLEARAALRGVSVDDYAASALGDGPAAREERTRLVELLRVGETRLFRHADQISIIADEVLPERRAVATREQRKLSLWSAGCATGEEAWTLALLADRGGGDWAVTGSDISETALEVAQRGAYDDGRATELPAWAMRQVTLGGGELCFAEPLRRRVRFLKHNILDAPPSTFDVILCRNVLIYFDAERRATALARLYQALRPGGVLLVGYSESLRDQPRFSGERRAGAVFWRRDVDVDPEVRQRRATPLFVPVDQAWNPQRVPDLPAPRSAQPSDSAGPPAPPPRPHMLALSGNYGDEAGATRLAESLRPHLNQALIVDLDGATVLGDAAARVLRRAISTGRVALRAARQPVRRWMEKQGLT
jgi:chemotaxis methyl-accepting protein methylase